MSSNQRFARSIGVSALIVAGLGLALACGDGEKSKAKKSDAAKTSTDTSTETDTDQTSTVNGAVYFSNNILSLLHIGCDSCHAEPRFPVKDRGPLTIFGYTYMKGKVSGASLAETALWKTLNDSMHSGRVSGAMDSLKPKLSEWRKIEFKVDDDASGSVDPNTVTGPGAITEVQATGTVFGVARNEAKPTDIVDVELYINGPKGTGTLLATVKADLKAHTFRYDLPAQYRDGCSHKIWGYGKVGAGVMLGSDGFAFRAYAPTDQNAFDAMKAQFNGNCSGNGCHGNNADGRGKDDLFASLVDPNPSLGKGAMASLLYRKASGQNHRGGNRCGGAGGPCDKIVDWFNVETKEKCAK